MGTKNTQRVAGEVEGQAMEFMIFVKSTLVLEMLIDDISESEFQQSMGEDSVITCRA